MTLFSRALLCSLSLLACDRQAPPAPRPLNSAATRPSPATSPVDELDGLDTRAAVPLLPMMANHQKQNMRDHLLVVQEIVGALTSNDFATIEHAVSRMGFSPPMGQMCTHMGAGAPGFTEQALHFHRTADTIAAAARARDRAAVLTALSDTLHECTSCHAAWKQRVVDDQTWGQATSSATPAAESHGANP